MRSAPPSSSGPPAAEYVAWGTVRHAITGIHNLETLLRSPRVGSKVLGDVLPEFGGGVCALRSAFAASAVAAKDDEVRRARDALCHFTHARLDDLERAMRNASSSELDARGRLGLEQVVTRVTVDLDAAAELLDLSERAEHAAVTEVSLDELARESIRAAPSGRERDIPVRLARSGADECVLRADAHVLKRLIAFAVARVLAIAPTAAAGITVRAVGGADHARIEVGVTKPAEGHLVPLSMRLVRRIEPTDAVVDAASTAAGIASTVASESVAMRVPSV